MQDTIDHVLKLVESNDIDSLYELAKSDLNINQISFANETNPLHLAIECDLPYMVKELLNLGGDIELIVHSQTPLQHAVDLKCLMINDDYTEAENLFIIQELLNRGASIVAEGTIGKSSLDIATLYNCQPIISFLTLHHPSSQ